MSGDFSSAIDIGLPGTPYGVPDELYDQFDKIYNAIRTLQQKLGDYQGLGTLDPTNFIAASPAIKDTIQIQRLTSVLMVANVLLPAFSFINLFNTGAGVVKARLADATNNFNRAHGYNLDVIQAGAVGIIYLWTGYLPGAYGGGSIYYLSPSTPGGITTAAPVTPGMIRQEVGFALSNSDLAVKIATPVPL
jgi:hypothetical protein